MSGKTNILPGGIPIQAISQSHNAIVIADTEGVIEWVNEGFTQMTGYTLDELRELKGNTLMETVVNLEMSVRNRVHLADILKRIRGLKEVHKVTRIKH